MRKQVKAPYQGVFNILKKLFALFHRFPHPRETLILRMKYNACEEIV
jgi:hypothetical protein